MLSHVACECLTSDVEYVCGGGRDVGDWVQGSAGVGAAVTEPRVLNDDYWLGGLQLGGVELPSVGGLGKRLYSALDLHAVMDLNL